MNFLHRKAISLGNQLVHRQMLQVQLLKDGCLGIQLNSLKAKSNTMTWGQDPSTSWFEVLAASKISKDCRDFRLSFMSSNWSQKKQKQTITYMAIFFFHQSHICPQIPKFNGRAHMQWHKCRFKEFSITASRIEFLFLKGWWQRVLKKNELYYIFHNKPILWIWEVTQTKIEPSHFQRPPSMSCQKVSKLSCIRP